MSNVKEPHTAWITAASALTAMALASTFLLVAASTADGDAALESSEVPTLKPLVAELFRGAMDLAYQGETDRAAVLFNRSAFINPRCASCLWGWAWALSSDLEGSVPGEREAEARSALRRAQRIRGRVPERERALIEALGVLFDWQAEPDPNRRRAAYAEAMRKVAHRYPTDPDVQAVFAFALVSAENTDHWSADGRPRPAIREALAAAHRAARVDELHFGAQAVYDHVAADLTNALWQN